MTPAPHTAPMGEQELIALAERFDRSQNTYYLRVDERPIVASALRELAALRAAASPRLAGREQIAKAIYQNRRGVSDYIANHDFAIYAKHPHGYDDGRVAIFAAYRDADSILSLLGNAPSESVGWRAFPDLPDVGRKFIALYSDGSGSQMLWRHDDGYIDGDGYDFGEIDFDQYSFWSYLPNIDFWCENRSDDPMCLSIPAPPTSHASQDRAADENMEGK